MFDNLSDKLQLTFKKLRGQATLTESNISDAMREIRLALLDADVNLSIVKDFISSVKENQECIIFSDSQLTINCANGKWKRKANLDLWKEYDKVSKNKIINFEWVKAHNGNKYNEIVDELAYNEAKNVNG